MSSGKYIRTEKARESLRLAQIEKWKNPEYRKHMSKAHLGHQSHLGFSKYLNEEEKLKAKQIQRRKWKKTYEEKNPEKRKAQIIISNKMKMPKDYLCEICKIRIAKHRHHDDYSKPLEVKFVCIPCHRNLHRR